MLLSSVRGRCPLVKSQDCKELLDYQRDEMRRVIESLPPHRLMSKIRTVRGVGMMYGVPGKLRDCPSTSIKSGGVEHLVQVLTCAVIIAVLLSTEKQCLRFGL